MDGGYDAGYRTCSCFWGREPGSLVRFLEKDLGTFNGLSVLDVGCGEGKNAVHLADCGAHVRALDISSLAIENAHQNWPERRDINWQIADICDLTLTDNEYDIVIAYGLLHCLSSADEIVATVEKLQAATKPHGYHLVCALNARFQDLSAHAGFTPCLVDHTYYVGLYSAWELVQVSDSDLIESHPHNNIRHTHALTRLIARKQP